MASGPQAQYDTIQPLLAGWAARSTWARRPGAGQVIKLVNNLLSLAAIAVLPPRAWRSGIKAGLDPPR